jgi:hypothetical protein
VTSSALAALLQEFYRDKLGLQARHVAGAQHVAAYEFNNTYQYIINREDTHLGWVRAALADAQVPVPTDCPALPVPAGKGEARQRAIIEDDARSIQAFHDEWAPRQGGITNARHANMIRVILGEAVEQKRFFDQMLEGREDVLGRRMAGATTGGGVLPVRWVE